MTLETLMENDKRDVHLVTTKGGTLQGIFDEEKVANEFATYFEGAIVEKESCYAKMPRFYKFECHLNLSDHEVIKNVECKPTFDPILLQLNKETVVAVGETADDAEKNAREFAQKISA